RLSADRHHDLAAHGCHIVVKGAQVLLHNKSGVFDTNAAITGSWKLVAAFPADSGRMASVVFSPARRTLATSANDPIAKLWNTLTGRPTLELEQPERHPDRLQFTPDGSALATLGGGSERLWRAAPFRGTAQEERALLPR